MKEFGQRASVHTLEDIIRSGSYRPTKEMLAGLAQARNMMQDFNLTNELGLNAQVDSILLHAFIADRILKTRLYDLEWAVHSPEFLLTPKQEKIDNLKRDSLQASLEKLANERGNIIDTSYIDEKDKIKVRNLELAANDLVARASINVDDGKHDPYTDIVVTTELLTGWSFYWKNKFSPKRQRARQKNLYYRKPSYKFS